MSTETGLKLALDAVRVRGQLFCRVEARAPWGLRGGPDPVATFHAVAAGHGFVRVFGVEEVLPIGPGQVVILPGGASHVVADREDADPAHFREVAHHIEPTGRLPLGGGGAPAHILCGAFHGDSRDAPQLFSLLPKVIVTPPDPTVRATIDLLRAEHLAQGPAWDSVTARLLPILLLQVLRVWFDHTPPAERGGLLALSDERLVRTLAAVHDDPADDWTVEQMAKVAGMSRSAFVERFTALLGTAPARYLTRHRLQVAAHLLTAPGDHGLAEVASRVGYRAEEAFCRSFKRHYGASPGRWRREALRA